MNKILATINCDLDLSKNGRAMLGEESKWLVLLELVKDRLFGRRSLEHLLVHTTCLIMGRQAN